MAAAARHDNWMPFYIGDYLKDTPHLDRALHGSYLLLIMACWTAGGELPDDDRQLAIIAKATPKEWKADRGILKPFFIVEGGMWRHKRVSKELARAISLTAKRSNAGGKGAAKRWQDHNKDDGTEIAEPMANASQTDGPLPLPLQKSSEAKASGAKAPARDVIFQECLPWLEKRSGKNCRALVGKWLAETKDDDAIRQLLEDAEEVNPIDPVGWIAARLKPREEKYAQRDREIQEAIQRSKLQ